MDRFITKSFQLKMISREIFFPPEIIKVGRGGRVNNKANAAAKTRIFIF